MVPESTSNHLHSRQGEFLFGIGAQFASDMGGQSGDDESDLAPTNFDEAMNGPGDEEDHSGATA